MGRDRDEGLFGDRAFSGPDAVLRNGMRMPPGAVISHEYLLCDPPQGEWFVDVFPRGRDEAYVRDRHLRLLDEARRGASMWALASDEGLLALPAHGEDRPVSLIFGSEALARAFAEQSVIDFDVSPEEIPFRDFLEEYLPAKIEEGSLIGTNWTPDLVGIEIEPELLVKILRK